MQGGQIAWRGGWVNLEPDGQIMFDKVDAAWNAPGDEFRLELTETEVNQYLAFVNQQEPDFFLRDAHFWRGVNHRCPSVAASSARRDMFTRPSPGIPGRKRIYLVCLACLG